MQRSSRSSAARGRRKEEASRRARSQRQLHPHVSVIALHAKQPLPFLRPPVTLGQPLSLHTSRMLCLTELLSSRRPAFGSSFNSSRIRHRIIL
eukprot:6214193-Pleurochrysis_carterae.AAC.1